jgi:alkylation response protein AidB-like acyl-CoA dehydrogenase
MDLVLSSEQEQLADAANSFVQDKMPLSRLQGASESDPVMMAVLGEMGWLGMSRPETLGGAGFGVADEVLVFREIGRNAGPISAIAAALAPGRDPVCEMPGWLEPVLGGTGVIAMAVPEQPVSGDDGRIEGRVRLFSTGDPRYALLTLPGETVVLALPEKGVDSLPGLDTTTAMAAVELADCEILASHKGPEGWTHGLLLVSAMLVGMAEATRDMINDYAKMRHTFGRPIGSYQAVRHPIAEMAARCEQARCLLFYAALAFEAGREDALTQASAARVIAQQAAMKNADANIQLHGGIGVTDDLPAHFFLKRAILFGNWLCGTGQQLDHILFQPIGDI